MNAHPSERMADIVKDYVTKKGLRMPETEEEINDYLDLINHGKEYAEAFELEITIGRKMMKKLGFKTSKEVISEFKNRKKQ